MAQIVGGVPDSEWSTLVFDRRVRGARNGSVVGASRDERAEAASISGGALNGQCPVFVRYQGESAVGLGVRVMLAGNYSLPQEWQGALTQPARAEAGISKRIDNCIL